MPPAGREGEPEGAERGQRRGGDEGPVRQLIEGLVRAEPVERARQRHVDEEELHPGEAGFRLPHHLAAEEPEADQSEEGRKQIEKPDQFGHRGLRLEGFCRERGGSFWQASTSRTIPPREGLAVRKRRARSPDRDRRRIWNPRAG